MKTDVASIRKLVWHLRAGGVKQARQWLEREQYAAGHRKLETVKGAEGVWTGRGKNLQLQFKPASTDGLPIGGGGKPRAAVILDEFSALGFQFEWETMPLSPRTWQATLEQQQPDFVFVESAWNGHLGQWAGKIARTAQPVELIGITAWCRERGIPTIFWNKEDPPHYDDFLNAARLFDFVFTSDAAKIQDYREDLGHTNVAVLPFAAQPAIHNPVRPKMGWHERDVAFGGMYFAEKYPERRKQLDLLLGAAKSASSAMATGLEIFSRQKSEDPRYRFPGHLADNVVGSLSYSQMLTAYKAYKVFLNVNSVTTSTTMCSRRVFEIVAAGSAVVTTPSPAIDTYFAPDEIFSVSSGEEAEQLLRALHRNPELGARHLHRGQRRIWQDHTYSVRSRQVLEAAVPAKYTAPVRPTVSAVVSTIRPWQLRHVFETVGSQENVDVELVLLTHGFEVPSADLEQLKQEFGVNNLRVLTADRSTPLGDCLNQCVEAATGDVITKMDDDDFYGSQYLSDQLYALAYSSADIVGKQAHYMYLESRNATLLRFPDWEHRYTRTVMGPTLMGRAAVFREAPFPSLGTGEDSGFLKLVTSNGGSVYAADRFNYCQHRSGTGHTWQVSDDALLATGDLKFFGNYRDQVSV